ncbi:murein L,D-transpeptidase catalytic domain family protein [Chryseobacterium foetidum]|uniref:murein L,D-transpeptidase catalytic domain family protein n=1 Tax=Chryseobacterium foetidum TaxID=2951057 RepID=UPI0021C884C9|nr:murein L,D-transpeptidase catalytic domain family protein [Chryseobacterium foetidum]
MLRNFLFFLILFLASCEGNSQTSAVQIPKEKITELKSFIKDRNYNQDLAVFINFKIKSGKYRYFVYDLKKDKILQSAIVSHGSGSNSRVYGELKFSNTENSYQSSLGKYEIKESYSGKFGKSYRLDGLDKTNSNARSRAIVIHSLDCVPDVESEDPACLSLGCPMLSPKALKQTAKYIDGAANTIILYAFY